eukprot:TRINITY_DN113437_c0_g1_i1.p1 TRINITY_DN113437_c0_g1~~TRINITY_DN113437_c0_g1_i1.p1  ORF type:complete len:213 (-),score=50.39 TRINITY_DN113437_c0_g1_i1:186-824(-)
MAPRLFFVRHGEAAHNPLITKGKEEGDAAILREGRSILNPRLTAKGKEQAEALKNQITADGMKFDLLVTTPLARAIETSYLAFADACERFAITAEAVETADEKLGGPQRGTSKEQMLADFPFLKDWDLSEVREDGDGQNWVLGDAIKPTEPDGGVCGPAYFNPATVEERLESLKAWLKALPYERVVVVSHSGVFDKLLGKNMKNCELVEHEL